MAVNLATIWECRTSGADTNGGGFVAGASGTDWSQQDTAQYALTGLASSGAGNTVLYASASADMVGNIAQCTGGTNFNTGFFQITSVSVGVSITFSTNAAGQSICSGVGASGAINIGGALVSLALAVSGGANGNIFYIKAGTYSISSSTANVSNGRISFTIASGGAAQATIPRITGYQTTRGDNGTPPVLKATTSMGSNIAILTVTGVVHVTNVVFDANTQTTTYCVTSAFGHGYFENCVAQNAKGTNAIGFNGALFFRNCVAVNCVTGFNLTVSNLGNCTMCIATACTTGFNASNNQLIFHNCIAYSNTGVGFAGSNFCINCVAYANGSDGFQTAGNSNVYFWINCHAEANTGKGFDANSSNSNDGQVINCGVYNNTAGNTSGTTNTNLVTLTSTAFTNAGSLDFSLNNTSTGGALLRKAGVQTYPSPISTVGFPDIGAVQHKDSIYSMIF
jgi:hypothetical protein